MLQHRLPQFYLRGFTRPAGARVLSEYEKGRGFTREIRPKRASAEVDAFEIDGGAPHEAERFFSRVEGFAKKSFDALRNRIEPTKVEREYLSVFMALCFVRSSKRAAENDEVCSRFNLQQIAEYLRSPSAKIWYMLRYPRVTASQYDSQVEEYVRGVDAGEIEFPRPPRGNELALVQSACTKWAICLESTDWSVEIAEGEDYFVVPDEPLVARRKGYPFDPTYVGINRADLGVEITLPLNRRMCLVAQHAAKSKTVLFRTVSSARVEEINLRSVVCAHKLVFSPVRSDAVESLLATVGARGIGVPMPGNFVEFLSRAEWRGVG